MGYLHGVGSPKSGGMKAAAAVTSLALSFLFLAVYGTTNWITSQRTDVGTWYFEWERAIPFVPFMIVPYLSIDLFFVAAPFLCSSRRELRTLALRIGLAIVVAGSCFLLLPLHFAFERPRAEGWLGAVFQVFQGLDQPFNLFPSLHITLRTILAELYARHTRGWVRIAVQVWFSLIGLSTVLTYQHHLVDIVGGFMLAGFCFYLFREAPTRLPVVRNFRIGGYFGAAALATLILAAVSRPWGVFLLWPGCALGIVTAAYSGVGPGIYRKSGGRLPLSTRFVLWPILLGQHLSLLYYRRQCRAWDAVAPQVFIGRKLSTVEAAEAIRQGVTAVLDLTAEFSEAGPFITKTYRNLPILDLTAPTVAQLREAAAFIGEQAAKGAVYVHCKIGYSRSATALGAYLLTTGQAASVEEAVDLLRKARPSIVVRTEAWQALRAFDRARKATA